MHRKLEGHKGKGYKLRVFGGDMTAMQWMEVNARETIHVRQFTRGNECHYRSALIN